MGSSDGSRRHDERFGRETGRYAEGDLGIARRLGRRQRQPRGWAQGEVCCSKSGADLVRFATNVSIGLYRVVDGARVGRIAVQWYDHWVTPYETAEAIYRDAYLVARSTFAFWGFKNDGAVAR